MAYVEDLLKRLEETSYFLTGCFLNGLLSAIKGQNTEKSSALLLVIPTVSGRLYR
jgi:hypothetical protein